MNGNAREKSIKKANNFLLFFLRRISIADFRAKIFSWHDLVFLNPAWLSGRIPQFSAYPYS